MALLPQSLRTSAMSHRSSLEENEYRFMKSERSASSPPGNSSNPSRTRSKACIISFLAVASFVTLSFQWCKNHRDFFEKIRTARALSINAEFGLKPVFVPFTEASSPESPVPFVDIQLLNLRVSRSGHASGWGLTKFATVEVPAFERHISFSPNAPAQDEIFFAIATTADRAISQTIWGLWPTFLAPPHASPCLVLLSAKEAHRVKDVQDALDQKSISCIVKTSDVERYQARVLSLPREAKEVMNAHAAAGGKKIKWLIMGDDDTLWLDKRGLQRLLSQHNYHDSIFIASTTERILSRHYFGRMAFGGGGLILSSGLVECYVDTLPECQKRWSNTFGGDEAVSNCIGFIKNVPREDAYINEPGLHQLDIYGLASGFLEAGIPMMTLHHFFSWAKLMPHWMHKNDDYKVLAVLLKAARFLGQDNHFKRYSLDKGHVVLVNGYSITTYLEPLSAADLANIEVTWGYGENYDLLYSNMRPPITTIGHRPGPKDLAGRQRKSSYYLQAVRDVDEARGSATFVYRNERGKEIVVHWEEGHTRL